MPIYIKLDGIKGSVTAAGHEDWSEVISLGWGAENVRRLGRGNTGRVRVAAAHREFVIIKKLDDLSVELLRALNLARVFPNMKIEVLQTGSGGGFHKFYSIDFKNVLVVSYNMSGSGEELTESISFDYEEYEVKYTRLDSDNTVMGTKSFQGTVGEPGSED